MLRTCDVRHGGHRDRFANTAIHERKCPEDVLLQQGAREDSETVRRFCAGVTDESQSIAMRIQGWCG